MSKPLMELVLPRLERRLRRQIHRYRAGKLTDRQFAERFEGLLDKLYDWLGQHGVPEVRAALAIHGAVLVLSGPGLAAEAAETGLPLERVEHMAVRSAASEIAPNYKLPPDKVYAVLARIMARYQ